VLKEAADLVRSRRDPDEGMVVYVKVNFRVLLLVAIIFDVFHLSVNELVQALL